MIGKAEVLRQTDPEQLRTANRQVGIGSKIEIYLEPEAHSQEPVVNGCIQTCHIRHETTVDPTGNAIGDQILK